MDPQNTAPSPPFVFVLGQSCSTQEVPAEAARTFFGGIGGVHPQMEVYTLNYLGSQIVLWSLPTSCRYGSFAGETEAPSHGKTSAFDAFFF